MEAGLCNVKTVSERHRYTERRRRLSQPVNGLRAQKGQTLSFTVATGEYGILTATATTLVPRETRSTKQRRQMQFIHHDLGYQQRGETVEVTLSGSAANVRLMDSTNFNSYKNGRQHRYHGGLATRSPVHLQIPHAGTWFVTVDMQGLRGNVRSHARLLPRPLPALREAPLSSVPSLVQQDDPSNNAIETAAREYDVFISHASEDKDGVVRPLAYALRDGGLSVWYDEFELRLGDSLRRKIDAGLAKSRFGVVVLSRSFFGKGWTNYELDGLVTRSVSGEQVILPIWHEITKKEVVEYSPSLADKVARSTGVHTVEEIADEIIDVIRNSTGTIKN